MRSLQNHVTKVISLIRQPFHTFSCFSNFSYTALLSGTLQEKANLQSITRKAGINLPRICIFALSLLFRLTYVLLLLYSFAQAQLSKMIVTEVIFRSNAYGWWTQVPIL